MNTTATTLFVLPEWAERIRQTFLAGEAGVFIVHGNIQDHVWYKDTLMTLSDFWSEWMQSTEKDVYEWSTYKGFGKREHADVHPIDTVLAKIKRIDGMLRGKNAHLVLIPHAPALIPGGDPQYRSGDERMLLAALQDWSMDGAIAQSNSIVVLLAESLMDLPRELLSNPRVSTIEIFLPKEDARMSVIRAASARKDPNDQGIQRIAQHTSGLKLVQIHSLFQQPKGLNLEQRAQLIRSVLSKDGTSDAMLEERVQSMADITASMTPDKIVALLGEPYTHEDSDAQMLAALLVRKRALIETECFGLIEFMDTRHGLDAVGGNDLIKAELLGIAKTIKSGNTRLAPMGLMAVGAMGSGKTFVIRAFLKEAGLTGLTLKNVRSKWVGSTEANLEKVLATVRAMGPVALVIDEGDRSFGSGDGESDGGTSSRLIGRLKEFMSDTNNRGQVLIILMTNRPDKLDIDIKRPGRLDRKIPFFYADSHADLRDVATVLCKRYSVDPSPLEDDVLVSRLHGYSNADIETLIGMYANIVNDDPSLHAENAFLMALDDFIPPREGGMVDYMNLLAVKEASRKSLVPARYHYLYEDGKLDHALQQAKINLY